MFIRSQSHSSYKAVANVRENAQMLAICLSMFRIMSHIPQI